RRRGRGEGEVAVAKADRRHDGIVEAPHEVELAVVVEVADVDGLARARRGDRRVEGAVAVAGDRGQAHALRAGVAGDDVDVLVVVEIADHKAGRIIADGDRGR